ncbi:MAG: hypothetical protein ACOYB8_12225 [Eubacteriaceae bacterium]|jgi:hypothetical protein
MKKSIYSLMLFDEIVEKIDQMAYVNYTNRSQLINEILAEHLGLVTPEQNIQTILETLKDNFSDTLSVSQVNKNSSIQFGKSLKYKYRPKVKYSIEFVGVGGQKYAVLKISSRTKSVELNEHFDEFFRIICELEAQHISKGEIIYETSANHKFIREFREEGSVSRDVKSVISLLTHYLEMIDASMDIYFENDGSDVEADIKKLYQKYLDSKYTPPAKVADTRMISRTMPVRQV